MKKVLVLAAMLMAVVSAKAFVTTNSQEFLAKCAARTDVPRPAKIRTPQVSDDEKGRVSMRFKVSRTGYVHAVEIINCDGKVDTDNLAETLRAWRFTPMPGQANDVDLEITFNVNGE
jgi:TonB family protein